MSLTRLLISILMLSWCISFSNSVSANDRNPLIQYNLGLAARHNGDTDEAYRLFKKACMALADPVSDACLAWAELAEGGGNSKDIKRALGSAVMLAPDDIRARFALAVALIKKQDYLWAAEHLHQAIPHARDKQDIALLHYYLGYSLFKNNDLELANKHLYMARADLPLNLQQRCDYYLALTEATLGRKGRAAAHMQATSKGPDPQWQQAASDQLSSWSVFPWGRGFSGQVSASFGLNTHPTSAFLDYSDTDSLPVLQSIFRGDGIYSIGRGKHGFQTLATVYREQNWTELGEKDKDSYDETLGHQNLGDEFTPQDFNMTLFFGRLAYISRLQSKSLEHQIKVGLDGELQFLDHIPIKRSDDNYNRSPDPFEKNAAALGGKVWWSLAKSSDSIYSLRLKSEIRPNYIDKDRSTWRIRMRFVNTRLFPDYKLKLRALAGIRYDLTYKNPKVIKYDRLLPEAELELRWRTPVPRLTVVAGGQLRFNWYLNSNKNIENSFRPANSGGDDDSEYYDLTRKDLEWETKAEIETNLWKSAKIVLSYRYHQRLSNIDDASISSIEILVPEFGYIQHVVMLDLRQRFPF